MNQSGSVPAPGEVRIPCGDSWLYGDLVVPLGAGGLVLLVHGSGSGSGSDRHSARNRPVGLQQAGIATLLFDLLTAQEAQVDLHRLERRVDVALLTKRLQDTTHWALAQPGLARLPVGYFGASTGSAAARLGRRMGAVVLRGGRPDLAGPVALATVTAPTLLVVGSADHGALELNEHALQHLGGKKQLAVVDRRHPPVRGARRAGAGGRTGRVLVWHPPGAGHQGRSGARRPA